MSAPASPPRGRTVTVVYTPPLKQPDGRPLRQTIASTPTPDELAAYLVEKFDRPAAAFQLRGCGLDALDTLGRERAELRFGACLADAGPKVADLWGVDAPALQRALRALTARATRVAA